jgi:hypothetical protein
MNFEGSYTGTNPHLPIALAIDRAEALPERHAPGRDAGV